MRALVTGGTGFIGANLVAALNRRDLPARVLHRPSSSLVALEGLEYEAVLGDIMSPPESLAEAMSGCDWVFHAAALSDYRGHDLAPLLKINLEGTKNVLSAAQMAGIRRFVYTSSLAALGVPEDGQILDETSEFNASPSKFPYGYSKHLAEIEVRRAAQVGLEAVIVNPTVVLGPRGVNQISLSLFVEAVKGRIRVYPPGGVNFVAVDDVVAGHITAAERGRPGERYILGGENHSFREALVIGCEIVGQAPPKFKVPGWILPLAAVAVDGARRLLGDRVILDGSQVLASGMKLYADNSKAIKELDLPQTPFREAVKSAYDWYNRHGYLG